jgi:hypothetical protein
MGTERHLPGPWMCFVAAENEYADFRVSTHIETGIAIAGDRWESEDDIIADHYGYNQPNGLCDISEERVATARLIAAAPCLLKTLGTLYALTIGAKEKAGGTLTEDEEILRDDTKAMLAKALGIFEARKQGVGDE